MLLPDSFFFFLVLLCERALLPAAYPIFHRGTVAGTETRSGLMTLLWADLLPDSFSPFFTGLRTAAGGAARWSITPPSFPGAQQRSHKDHAMSIPPLEAIVECITGGLSALCCQGTDSTNVLSRVSLCHFFSGVAERHARKEKQACMYARPADGSRHHAGRTRLCPSQVPSNEAATTTLCQFRHSALSRIAWKQTLSSP